MPFSDLVGLSPRLCTTSGFTLAPNAKYKTRPGLVFRTVRRTGFFSSFLTDRTVSVVLWETAAERVLIMPLPQLYESRVSRFLLAILQQI
jgi:hypothetical protein